MYVCGRGGGDSRSSPSLYIAVSLSRTSSSASSTLLLLVRSASTWFVSELIALATAATCKKETKKYRSNQNISPSGHHVPKQSNDATLTTSNNGADQLLSLPAVFYHNQKGFSPSSRERHLFWPIAPRALPAFCARRRLRDCFDMNRQQRCDATARVRERNKKGAAYKPCLLRHASTAMRFPKLFCIYCFQSSGSSVGNVQTF